MRYYESLVQLIGNTPAQFRAVIIEEIARWKKVVVDAGIKPQD